MMRNGWKKKGRMKGRNKGKKTGRKEGNIKLTRARNRRTASCKYSCG